MTRLDIGTISVTPSLLFARAGLNRTVSAVIAAHYRDLSLGTAGLAF